MNIYLIGYMAVGKTTIAKKLAARMGRQRIDLDALIEKRSGKTIPEIFSSDGEACFRKLEAEVLLETFSMENAIVATGGGTPCFFNNMEKIKAHGLSVWIRSKPEIIASRLINAKVKRPLLLGKSSEEIVKHTKDLLQKREPFYKQADIYFDHNSRAASLDELVEKIEFTLNKRHP